MEDSRIIDLYWARDEAAVTETDAKDGPYCRSIAQNLLGTPQDAEECVNDTWHAAWRSMPPQRPARLRAWLGRVVRNLSLDRWRRDHAEKRDGGIPLLLDELAECLPSPRTVEAALEAAALTAAIDAWLGRLPKADRVLFLRRYWYGVPLKDLAAWAGTAPDRLAQKMYRLRRSLKTALEEEGITL